MIKTLYLRDRRTERIDCTGTHHDGLPAACVVSTLNREERSIRYAVALVHPKDTFRKKFARHIAIERLNGVGKNDKPKAFRLGTSSKTCSGARAVVREELSGGSFTSPGRIRLPLPTSGHELTKLVMQNIVASVDLPDRLRDLAADWLEYDIAMMSDKVPTIPVPVVVREPLILSSGSANMEESSFAKYESDAPPARRMEDNPTAMRDVALNTTDRRHRDAIVPPPATKCTCDCPNAYPEKGCPIHDREAQHRDVIPPPPMTSRTPAVAYTNVPKRG